MSRILFVVSASDHWTLADGPRHASGYWADELSEPHQVFATAGWDIVVATPGGVAPTPDAGSLSDSALGGAERARRVREYLEGIDVQLMAPARLEDVTLDEFDAVFYPGGYGPMEDLAQNADSALLLVTALERELPLGLVCHGPAALIATQRADGSWPFAGYRMTAFTDEEERDDVLADRAKWLLQSRLEELGADFVQAPMFTPNVVSDRSLHTGQNPKSSTELAEVLLAYAENRMRRAG